MPLPQLASSRSLSKMNKSFIKNELGVVLFFIENILPVGFTTPFKVVLPLTKLRKFPSFPSLPEVVTKFYLVSFVIIEMILFSFFDLPI